MAVGQAGGLSKQGITLLLLAVGVVAIFLLSLLVGAGGVGIDLVLRGLGAGAGDPAAVILWEIRFPRAVLALAIGATLGLSGAALQGFLRNPLAEPGLIGISASAAFGAVLALHTGLAAMFSFALPAGGMLGAFVAVLAMQFLAGRDSSTLTLILAGIAITSFAAALTSLALNLAPSPFAALEIVFWMLGSLTDRSIEHVWLAVPFMLLGWAFLFSLHRALVALTLGEDVTETLGFDLRRIRIVLVIGTACSVGAATAVAGAIGFVGLVVPHLLRPLVAHRPDLLLPASALGGALLLCAADIAVRLLSGLGEIRLGVLTALVGTPFFLFLLLQMRRQLA